jgi:5-methyltetrahydropteroyltriglutamate--homocysteine methyltransferase
MKRSTARILTTHCGSLPRPADLLDLVKARASGETVDAAAYDAPLKDTVDALLKINAGAISFEAANARHEHEYHVWETVKLPEGKVLIPGVITHASNIVEHPELIARYAKLVGRENLIAGADCGFSSQATYRPEVHPKVV